MGANLRISLLRVSLLVASLGVMLCPATVLAQSAAASSASPAADTSGGAHKKGGDITRDAYIERAKRNAEKRFNRMDANHDGVLTLEERRAARTKRRGSNSE